MTTSKTGVALFVYKRPEHTLKVLEGLKKNSIKKLYIFADGPKKNDDENLLKEVRKVIRSIDWCETEIHQNEINRGLAESEISGINYILERHERIILLEDDCVPSQDFIDFMEQCLDKYDSEVKVMNIAAYTCPLRFPKDYPYDVYFTYRTGSHGQAFWRRSWQFFERYPSGFEKIMDSKNVRRKLDRAGRDIYFMLKQQLEGKLDSIGVWWTWSVIKNNGVCVNPIVSRIQNIGHDGTGVHCGKTDKYQVEWREGNFKKESRRFPLHFEVNPTINRRLNNFVHGMLRERVKDKIKKVLGITPSTSSC